MIIGSSEDKGKKDNDDLEKKLKTKKKMYPCLKNKKIHNKYSKKKRKIMEKNR